MNNQNHEERFASVPSVWELVRKGELEASEDFNCYPSPALPLEVARRLVGEIFTTPEGHRTLVSWKGNWWRWQARVWQRLDDDITVKSPIWTRLSEVTYPEKGEEKAWSPSSQRIQSLLEPIRVHTLLNVDEAPTWLDQRESPNAERTIAMKNGILDLETRTLFPHSPAYFNTGSLGYSYDPDATCPEWENFLGDIFEHDPKGALLLQEYAGYILSGRMEMQKALLIVGPPRSGKGTISRTLQQLIGRENSISPNLSSLGDKFGVSELVGKLLAVIEDARGSTMREAKGSVESLLNIIGEDAVMANRKGKSYWTGTLPTRFVLVSNEVPHFIDSSGAIKSRFMAIKLQKGYADNPDTTLGDRISEELPGIFNWALAGLDRLNTQGRFTQPETMGEVISLMGELGAPVKTFLDECCTITGGDSDLIRVSDLQQVFNTWNRLRSPGAKELSQSEIRKEVEAASSRVRFRHIAAPGETKRDRWFAGIKMTS